MLRWKRVRNIGNKLLRYGWMSALGNAVTTSRYLDEPPRGPTPTAYDMANVKTYLRLLDAEAQGANWAEVVETIFGISASREPDRAERVHRSHLERAKWMTRNGYNGLLAGPAH